MRLRDLVLDELADVHADADLIAERAGITCRRRRHVRVAAGIAAALTLGGLSWVLSGHGNGGRAIEPANNTSAPTSGAAIAGAISVAIDNGVLGNVGTPQVWEGVDASPAGYGVGANWPASGGFVDSASLSFDLVRPDHVVDLLDLDGALPVDPSDMEHLCPGAACTRIELPDGDSLLTVTRDRGTGLGVSVSPAKAAGGSVRTSTTVLLSSPRRDLVILADARASTERTARPLPSAAELAALVEEPWWGWQMPAAFQTRGTSLAHYTDRTIDSTAATTGSTTPQTSASPDPAIETSTDVGP